MKRARIISYVSPKVAERIKKIAEIEKASISSITEKAILLGLKELEEIYGIR